MPRIIDLTHSLVPGRGTFPGDPEFSLSRAARIEKDQYNVSRICFSSHQGTHLDAPFHFSENGRTVDRIEPGRCCGPASLIDLLPGGGLPPGASITLEMLICHSELFLPGARIIYRTGWDRFYPSPEYFENYPSLTHDAAEWIASRRIHLLGMDTPGPSARSLEVHRVLLGTGVEMVILESLTNLGQLSPRFHLVALPLKIERGDGSPVRAIAIMD